MGIIIYIFKQNFVAYALSINYDLFTVLTNEVTSIDSLPTLYSNNEEFSLVWEIFNNNEDCGEFNVMNGYLFFRNVLCIPKTFS